MASKDTDQLYKQLSQSVIGKDLLEWCMVMYDSNMEKALKSQNPHDAYGYLKTAYGIMEVVKHITSRADLANPNR